MAVNATIKQILFGAQKQANRANDAVVNYVEEYLGSAHLDYDSAVMAILKQASNVVEAANSGTVPNELDNMFMSLVFGPEYTIGADTKVAYDIITETGKVQFWLESDAGVTQTIMQVNSDRRSPASYSAEVQAMQLVEQILAKCPNRQDYPEDDVLAAIMYGKIYWREARA